MDSAAEALLGLRDCDLVHGAPEENFRDSIERVSPLLDAVSKDMAFEVNSDITGKKKRRKVKKKKVNIVNEIQSMLQMEMNIGSTKEIMAPTNGILGASDSLTEAVPNPEKGEQPRLNAVPKENGSEVNTSTTKKKKPKKKVNVSDEIPCTNQIEMNMGSTEDLVEVKAPVNGNSGAPDVISDYHVVTGERKDILSRKDVPQLEIADQPRLDAVPKEYGSEGNTDTTNKKKRKKKVAVFSEIQGMHETEKNMGSAENLVENKAQRSDNVGASDNPSDYNVVVNNEPKKNLPDKDVPLKLSKQLEMDVVSKKKTPECSADITKKRRRKKKETAINEIQSMDETVKNLPSNNVVPVLEPCEQPKLDHVAKENTSDMSTAKKRKRKKKVTVINEAQCMGQMVMDMASIENHAEIKFQVNDNLGATDDPSDYHVVNNEPEKNIPSKDIPMLELLEQPKLDVSKENASDTDTTKKKKRKKKVPVITVTENHPIQDMLQTEVNMGITENHMEINGSDNMGDYHVVHNEPEKNLPDNDVSMLELVKHPELDAGLVIDASEETTGTKKKKKPKKKVNVLNEVRNIDQTMLNAVTTENITEIIDQKNSTPDASNGVRDCYAVNEELENNLVDKVLTTVPVTAHSNLGPTSTENHSENAETEKKTKRKGKKANVMNEVPIMDQGITENIAEMKDEMDHTVVNSESEKNLINGTVGPLSEHTKLDAVSTESGLEGSAETKKRKRVKGKKVKDMNEVQSTNQLEMNAGTSESLAALENQIEDRVEPADKIRTWISKKTERSVARRKNKLKKMNPSDAMYKIILSDEEPFDAMFKILLPGPPTCLVHSVPCESQQQHRLNQLTEENDEFESGINELKNEKCLPEGLGKLQKLVSVNPIKRKLIVLDVNGLLADVVMPAPKDCRGDIHILGRAIFKRPFCDDFLNFCFQNFDVGIWSSRSKVIIDRIVDYLLGSLKDKLLFCWNMSHATQTGSKTLDNVHKPLVCKELRKIWENFEGYDKSNTLLLDDSPYKALLNPLHTAIFPSSFHYGDKNDNSLGPGGDLRVYLEGVLASDNVQSYVEQNPFGQGAINEMDPSWEFYSGVLQTVTSRSQSNFLPLSSQALTHPLSN